jgi:catechol 2,3-dioxygenase
MYKTKIGHAHLKVRDLDRAIAFYERFFAMHITERLGDHYVFLTGGEMHHEIALQNVGPAAPTPHPYSTGLYHIAFEVPDQVAFAHAYRALVEAGVRVALVDHLISWALYFDDPDGNGLEIYWDTRHLSDEHRRWDGRNAPLTADRVLAALSETNPRS